MLTLIALSAVLMQNPPPPPARSEEVRSSFVMVGGEGPDALDRDGDGQVSREEFAAPLDDRFRRMDKDGDGRLSADEMAAGGHGQGAREVIVRRGDGEPGLRRFELRRPMSDGAREVVVLSGPDGGPDVRRFEFRTPADGDRSTVLRERVDASGDVRVIRRAPRDGSSDETRFEIRRLDGADGPRSLDTDNDGRISEAEFTAPLREAFARADADRSGFVEEGERGRDGDVRVFTQQVETGPDHDD